MADTSLTPPSEGLEKLLASPELLRTIASLTGGSAAPDKTAEDGLARTLADPALMAKLPEVMAMLRPMMQENAHPEAASVPSAPKPQGTHRDELLLALKPFLSPERAAAIDLLLKLGRLGSVLNALK